MRKIKLIATTEFLSIVRSKAFLFGLLVLPVMMALMIFLQGRAAVQSAERSTQETLQKLTEPFFMLVRDPASLCNAELSEAAAAYNQRMLFAKRPRLELMLSTDPAESPGALSDDLKDQLKSGKLDAYIELPAGLLEGTASEATFHTIDERWFQGWLHGALNECLQTKRLLRAGLSEPQIKAARAPIALTPKSPLASSQESPKPPEETAPAKLLKLLGFVVPAAMVFLMFILVMMSIQPLLTTVLEEKMSRISEVLLGMVSPFELMMGKLIGSLGASFLVAVLYVGSGVAGLFYLGYLALVPWSAFVYFLLFLFPAVFFFGSIYLAVGAVCNDVKDAQSLLTPFMLLMMTPLFAFPFVIREPHSALVAALSLIPPATPFLMLMRVAMVPGPPLWQLLLSLLLTPLTAALFVFAAGRIFRAGLLMQGKAPTLREMLKWAIKP